MEVNYDEEHGMSNNGFVIAKKDDSKRIGIKNRNNGIIYLSLCKRK